MLQHLHLLLHTKRQRKIPFSKFAEQSNISDVFDVFHQYEDYIRFVFLTKTYLKNQIINKLWQKLEIVVNMLH